MSLHFNSERNIQIVVSLLKKHGIRKVVASPGGNDATFIASLQIDPWFEIYSEVDERSAAYLATGLAAETGQKVAIVCTGATSSRNYMPGLTEAYYRKLPIIAITCSQVNAKIGHLIGQVTDRTQLPSDVANISVQLQPVCSASDEWDVMVKANKAMLGLSYNGGGPCHINLQMYVSTDFSIKKILPVRKIERYTIKNNLPSIEGKSKVGVFVGSHNKWSDELTRCVDKFCENYNACVFYDHTSNYKGKYGVLFPLVVDQYGDCARSFYLDLMIHIGYVANSSMTANKIWRVNPDGEIRDTFGHLVAIFQMEEIDFFESYNKNVLKECQKNTFWEECSEKYEELVEKMPEFPFSNIWIAQQTSKNLPENSVLHLGIRNSIRSWNLFRVPQSVMCYCNTGGFGIDGGVSSLIGASLSNPNKLFLGVFGDLAFFYNLNVLGNKHIKSNVRIIVINNGLGQEFRNSCFFGGVMFSEKVNEYIAAEGHFGRKSKTLVKGIALSLGFDYYCASSKEDYEKVKDDFLSLTPRDKPMIFEVFTESQQESAAFDMAFALTNKGKMILKTHKMMSQPEMMDVKSTLKKILK